MFTVKVRLIYPLKLLWKLRDGCIVSVSCFCIHSFFPMLLSSTVYLDFRRINLHIDVQGSQEVASSIFFSICCCNIYSLVSSDFVFIDFLLYVLSSVNFFISMLGWWYDLFKLLAKLMDNIHSSCFLILEKKLILVISCRFDRHKDKINQHYGMEMWLYNY